jgi:hypothetical protein
MCIISGRVKEMKNLRDRPTSVPKHKKQAEEKGKGKRGDRPGPDPNPNVWYNTPLQILTLLE